MKMGNDETKKDKQSSYRAMAILKSVHENMPEIEWNNLDYWGVHYMTTKTKQLHQVCIDQGAVGSNLPGL